MARNLCAYAPDPEVTPPVIHSDFATARDLPVVAWMPARQPTRLMQLIRAVIVVFVAAFALAQIVSALS